MTTVRNTTQEKTGPKQTPKTEKFAEIFNH